MKAFTALYLATARQFLRDRMAILFTLLLPLVMAGFFGLIFANEASFHLTVGLSDEDHGPVAAALIQALESPEAAAILTLRRGEPDKIAAQVAAGDLPLAIHLPAGLSANAGNGEPTPVILLWDEAQAAAAGPGLAMVRQLIQEVNISLMGAPVLLQVSEEAVVSRQIPEAQLYVPGMLSLAILWLGVFGTAPPLAQMRELQVLRRVAATPLRRSTMLAAQVAFRITTGMLQATLLVGYGLIVYGMEIVGGWLPLIGVTLLGSLLFVTLGFLLANLAKGSDSVLAIGQVVQFPMMFLSGNLFPMEALPDFLRPVAAAMPLTYLGDALRQVLLGAPPLYPLWVNVTVLVGVLILLLGLSVRFFRWE